jgi:hypothetical protein
MGDTINLQAIHSHVNNPSGSFAQFDFLNTYNVIAFNKGETVNQNEEVTLTLGSTGDIKFILNGTPDAGQMFVDDVDESLNFMGKGITKIQGGDADKSVVVSNTTFTFDVGRQTNIIDAGLTHINNEIIPKNFEFHSKLVGFTGSAQVEGDIIANGHIISQSLNVGIMDNSNVVKGFGFRVNDKHALELYKYDQSSNITQRVAVFGEGDLFRHDAYSDFPVFGVSNYEPRQQLTLGDSQGAMIWENEGANVYYSLGKVIIGDSNCTNNPDYSLEVKNSLYVEDALNIGLTGVQITSSSVKNVGGINFNSQSAESGDPTNHGPFAGTTSSVFWDSIPGYEYNKTWVKNNQLEVNLSKFYNDMNLSNFTNNPTWFDTPQTNISLSSFTNDLVDFSDLTLDVVSVDKVVFKDISAGTNIRGTNDFKGDIRDLTGISTFNVSQFNDDIITKNSLTITNLSIGEVTTAVVPSDTSLTVGTATKPFLEGNFGQVQVAGQSGLCSITQTVNNQLTIDCPLVVPEGGIIFADGTTITSYATEGNSQNDLDFYNYEFYNERSINTIKIQYNFSTGSVANGDNRYTLYVYQIEAIVLIPDLVTGLINLLGNQESKKIFTVNNKYFEFDYVKEDGDALDGKLILATHNPETANDLIDMRAMQPNTSEFAQKFKSDFDYFFNAKMKENVESKIPSVITPWGMYTGEVNSSGKVMLIQTSSATNSGNGIVEYLSYFVAPIYSDTIPEVNPEYAYHFDNSIEDRKDGVWYYYSKEDAMYYMKNNKYMYPKISFKKWDNKFSTNNSSIKLTKYDSALDWFSPNGDVNVSHFSSDWLRELLSMTYAYIKYGNPSAFLTTDDANKIAAKSIQVADFEKINVAFGSNNTVTNGIRFAPTTFSVVAGDVIIV